MGSTGFKLTASRIKTVAGKFLGFFVAAGIIGFG
jgi:hypothetical protein